MSAHLLSSPNPEGYCGRSVAEARSLGCLFDPTSFSWLKSECFDEALTMEFLDAEDWHWYFDMEKQHEANRASVLAGDHELLFVDPIYHLQHCTYMWRKLHRAVLNGSVVDGYIGSYKHTVHCGSLLVNKGGLKGSSSGRATVLITAKYPACSRDKDGMRAGWYRTVNRSMVRDILGVEKDMDQSQTGTLL